ncbi:DUF5721 family protein [Eubacterium oxidoreducens]|uniref:Uncharacterized protein n=1 Tax=Eubacterium oxidoreducens TaxID=1732 RepID=A0A1G6AWC9_EUBOX|nr:DUF5721 family protein [Eubacterium oxidoreducens]SDB12716.1 hypothetical protein SAMN02910417_00971 [Eubacterium oxidoreducens]
MVALQLTNEQQFLDALLKNNTFDNFLLEEATIFSLATFSIDGHINESLLKGDDEKRAMFEGCDCLPFSYLKKSFAAYFADPKLIHSYQLTMKLSTENLIRTIRAIDEKLSPADYAGLYMNFRMQNQLLTCTPGVSHLTFTMDHQVDRAWDHMTEVFLKQSGLEYEAL